MTKVLKQFVCPCGITDNRAEYLIVTKDSIVFESALFDTRKILLLGAQIYYFEFNQVHT